MPSHVTTHVLDSSIGQPAVGVTVLLHRADDEGWTLVARAATDENGRVAELGPEMLSLGRYRLRFGTGDYFASRGVRTFYPQVSVEFELADAEAHYHVPLLVGPFHFTTYRGT